MDIPLDVEVQCLDDVCGRSQEVVLDRKTEKVTHLVVREKHSPHVQVLVPIDLVTEATPRAIRVRCTREELAALQPFLTVDVVKENIPSYVAGPYLLPIEIPQTKWVAVERESIPPGEVAVRRGAHVSATDGRVGRLDEIYVDPATEQVTYLVMREGHLWGERDVTIPVSAIDRLEENNVHLKLNKKQVEMLPSVPLHDGDGIV